MSRFTWLLRREWWEHPAIWIAPAVVLGVLLLSAITGNIHLGPLSFDSQGQQEFADAALAEGKDLTGFLGMDRDEQVTLVGLIYGAITVLPFMAIFFIAVFYALDALYADRRDRSVLFWKSLPLSDTETVLSKATMGAVVIPSVGVLAGFAAIVILCAGGAVKSAMSGGDWTVFFAPRALGMGVLSGLLVGITFILWFFPLIAYLLACSAWATRAPFLWAVLPPVTLTIVEEVVFDTNYVAGLIGYLFAGFVDRVKPDFEGDLKIGPNETSLPTDMITMFDPAIVLPTVGNWIAIAVGVVLVFVAIRGRIFRSESN